VIPRLLFSFAVIYLVWGSTYLGIRITLESMPPFLMAAARFLVAGGLLYGFARLRGAARPSAAAWRGATILGGLMFLLGNGMVVWAETRVNSGLAALIAAGTPLWVVVIDHARPGGRQATRAKWGGVVLGILGLAILFLPDVAGGPQVDSLGALALMGASVSWAAGSISSRGLKLPSDPALASGMTMLAGGVLLAVVAAGTGEVTAFEPAAVTGRSFAAWLYLVLFGSILAFTCFTWLLAKVDPVKVATSGLVNPLVALLLGAWLADEVVGRQAVLAAMLTLAGLALILLAPEVRRTPPGRTAETAIPGPDIAPAVADASDVGCGAETKAAA
jgi:drug/metabolite transporter (DMT)-like permease